MSVFHSRYYRCLGLSSSVWLQNLLGNTYLMHKKKKKVVIVIIFSLSRNRRLKFFFLRIISCHHVMRKWYRYSFMYTANSFLYFLEIFETIEYIYLRNGKHVVVRVMWRRIVIRERSERRIIMVLGSLARNDLN